MAGSAPSMKRPASHWWPAALTACALAAYGSPGLAALLVYDRSAILGGELWRLVTGHWVHFSASHLACDAVVFGVSGWLIESRGYRFFPALCAVAASAIGLAMLAALPDMAQYGGLSGVAMASTVYLALHGRREAAPWRWIFAGILALSIGKLLYDVIGDGLSLIDLRDGAVINVPMSHFAGAAAGLAMYLWSAMRFDAVGAASGRSAASGGC
jgi:rhomboid family GlyGly-CTERM serine protease